MFNAEFAISVENGKDSALTRLRFAAPTSPRGRGEAATPTLVVRDQVCTDRNCEAPQVLALGIAINSN